MPNRTVTCGDCIHADICKQINGGWFSRENIAYCKAFKDRTNFVEVVRCNECENYSIFSATGLSNGHCALHHTDINTDDFCSYGERKDNE